MAIINKPHTFVAFTTKAGEAAQVNSDYDVLYNEFNGGISDSNIAQAANIQQSKIANLIGDLDTIRGQKVQEIAVQTFGIVGVTTYTKPLDLLFANIIVIGAGGGGGGARSTGAGFNVSSGGGGGAGAYAESWLLAALIGVTEQITIGQGGAPGDAAAPGNGFTGGASAFGVGNLVQAAGGGGGAGLLDSIGISGVGGLTGIGQILLGGNPGQVGFIAPSAAAAGGQGGSGVYSVAGKAAPTGSSVVGGDGLTGGGGAGAASVGVAQAQGGAGGNGLVLVIEFKA